MTMSHSDNFPASDALKAPQPTKTCRCGNDRTHYAVSAEGKYSAWGWFCNLFGITARPRQLLFRCRQCDQVFDMTEDTAILESHV
jgi:hypothetical protein